MCYQTIIIPSAGLGLRLGLQGTLPKCLIQINNKIILENVIDYWIKENARFIVVVHRKYKEIEKLLKRLYVNYEIVLQDKLSGVGDAILCAEHFLAKKFIVHLGDCLLSGEFINEFQQGIGIWDDADDVSIKANYGVLIRNNKITKVEEKPKDIRYYACGMGIYFFDEGVLEIIKKTPYVNGKREITNVLSKCLELGYPLRPVRFRGAYFNINTQADLRMARKYYKELKRH